MIFTIYFLMILFFVSTIFVVVVGVEQLICIFRNIAPAVSSGPKKREAVIKQIKCDFPNAKTILDIGSGWGAMASAVAKSFPKAKIYGIEIMPMPFIYSRIRFVFRRNIKFIFGNAFKYFEKNDEKFDVGIAYLLTPEMKNVEMFLSKFDLLLAVDFPLPEIKPFKTIILHKDKHAQHHLYVYKVK